MSINAISSSNQNQRYMQDKTLSAEREKPGGISEINQLNAEIEKEKSELKETVKEVQEAVGESIDGSSEKVQMLQNKMQMQQQAILMKQLKIKEIETPSKTADTQAAGPVTPPRFDEFVKNDKVPSSPGIYSLEQDENGNPVISFDSPETPSQKSQDASKLPSEDERPETTQCTSNTDKVDAEIKKLKEQQQSIRQKLRQAESPEEKAQLEAQLSRLVTQLQEKDNDAYRKQNATYTNSEIS